MDKLPANAVDLIVVAVLALSALLAFSRGFTRETLSIIGWVTALFATLYGLDTVRPYARAVIAFDLLADSIAAVAIFVVTLAAISLVSGMISKRLRESSLGPLDRSLGVLFGLLRGVILVCLGFIFINWIHEEERPPDWLAEARFSPLLEAGGGFLLSLAPQTINPSPQPPISSPIDNQQRQAVQQEVERLSNPRPQPGKTAEETGYSRQERRDMDRLHNSLEGN